MYLIRLIMSAGSFLLHQNQYLNCSHNTVKETSLAVYKSTSVAAGGRSKKKTDKKIYEFLWPSKKLWKTAKKMWIFVNIKIIQLRNQNTFLNFIFNKYWSYDSIISLRGDVCVHKTSLTLPLSTEVPVPSEESDRSCISLLRVHIYFTSFYDFSIWFWNCLDSVVVFVFILYETSKNTRTYQL